MVAQVAATNGRPMPVDEIVAEPPGERVGVGTLSGPRLRRTTVMLWETRGRPLEDALVPAGVGGRSSEP